MKKLLSVLLIAGGLVAASSAVTMAIAFPSWEPTLTVVPATGEPGFEFTATVNPCAPPLFNGSTEPDSEPMLLGTVDFSVTQTDGTPIGTSVVGECTDHDLIATADLVAPDQPGTYTVRAVVSPDFGNNETRVATEIRECGEPIESVTVELDDYYYWFEPCFLTATITVTAPTTTTTSTTTTTTTTTTIAPTTTTAATTTTVVDDSGAAVPTTTTVTDAPVVTLPATGPGDSGVAWMALLLLVAGAALTVGARSRRENTSA